MDERGLICAFVHDDKILTMDELPLLDKTILVTGAARRVGRLLALACADAGANVIVHYGHSQEEAGETVEEISKLGRRAWSISADLNKPSEVDSLINQAGKLGVLYALINSAAIFAPLRLKDTDLEAWQRHININLTAPFLLSKALASQLDKDEHGRIINILDWRAIRPNKDHFPYVVSKAALAAMTKSLAIELAPNITVNGIALGAVLPPENSPSNPEVIKSVPAARWAKAGELEQTLLFLLAGPAYVTGEIIHLDGGRHLS